MKSEKKTAQTLVQCDKSLDGHIEYSTDLICFIHKITLFDMGFRCQKILVKFWTALQRKSASKFINKSSVLLMLHLKKRMCAFTEYPCQWGYGTVVQRQWEKKKN